MLAGAMASCKTNPSFAVCGQPISCGQGTVQSCASADGSRCSFRNSDGSSVECASCGNCGDAQQQVASWCGGVPIGLGGGGAGSGGGAGGGGAGGGGAGGGGAGGGSGGGGSGGTTQSLVCQQYLACAAVAAPATFPQLVPVYGPSGSCWTDAALAASCTQACQRSLDDLAATSAAPECHAASTDMAQPSPHDLAQPPPRDMSAPPGSDLACLVFGYQCNGDPTCCSQCCAGGCVTFGYCAL